MILSQNTLTAKEICQMFGLDFKILKIQNTFELNGVSRKSAQFSLVNEKNGMEIGHCKQGYVVSQNEEVLELILEALSFTDDVFIANAKVLNHGKKIFYQLQVGYETYIGTESITRYITVIDSNDGSSSLAVGVGNQVKSCDNQFWSFYGKSDMKFRHSASLEEKLKILPGALQEAMQQTQAVTDAYELFMSKTLHSEHLNELTVFMYHVLGWPIEYDETGNLKEISTYKQNRLDEMEQAIRQELSLKGMTVWGLFNGVTYFTTHVARHPNRENGDLESLIAGNNYKVNQRAFEYCLELAKQL